MKTSTVALATLLSLSAMGVSAAPILWISDSAGRLGTVDVDSGDVAVIGSMGRAMTDIAFDQDGNLYGITFNALYSIDTDTAQASLIGSTGTSSNSLVFDSFGTLYTANTQLYTLDTNTGSSTLIGNGGDTYSSSGDLAFIEGALYLSNNYNNALTKLDTASGEGSNVGSIGYGSVWGLASDNNVDLYGLSGFNVLSINEQTGAGNVVANFANQGLSQAWGSAFYSEAGATEVSEPASIALFGLSALGFGAWRRRQSKA